MRKDVLIYPSCRIPLARRNLLAWRRPNGKAGERFPPLTEAPLLSETQEGGGDFASGVPSSPPPTL